jgi:hypothetical protein
MQPSRISAESTNPAMLAPCSQRLRMPAIVQSSVPYILQWIVLIPGLCLVFYSAMQKKEASIKQRSPEPLICLNANALVSNPLLDRMCSHRHNIVMMLR